ncbi:MAG: fused MFS/spermidine synthase, partial [Pseudomonadales bacterium]|nr:fused MFS/spermidine synthase [Pseudomonadales bacterium]
MDLKLSGRTLLYALLVIFVASGFSGLIYQSIWSHYLKLMLGHAAYAQTLVLAIFMGGMTLGAWLLSMRTEKLSNPLLFYAICELVVGLFAIFFHQIFLSVDGLVYETFYSEITSPFLLDIIKWSTAIALILPQSILLGMTFPLMSAVFIREMPNASGKWIAFLYFSNSFGAAAGVLASAFYFIPNSGLPGASLFAGVTNILIALVCFLISRDTGARELKFKSVKDTTKPIFDWLLLVALFTGLASFLYEIAWIRMLSLVLGSSMQAFELMLSAFILGLALGGFWIRNRIDNIENSGNFLGRVQLIMGGLALLSVPLYSATHEVMIGIVSALQANESGYMLFHGMSHLICLAIMFPAAFMAGMTLPLITQLLLNREGGEKAVGRVYAFNTLGAIVGVLVAVHVVMPFFGVKNVVLLGGLIDIVLGVYLLYRFGSKVWFLWAAPGVALVIMVMGITLDPLKLSSGVYRTASLLEGDRYESLYYRDGKTASISLYKDEQDRISIATNGKVDASLAPLDQPATADELTMILAASIPMGLHPDAKLVANIGMGSGLTTHALLAMHGIERVDTIEIEPYMSEAAKLYGGLVENAYKDPRSSIHFEDAKSFFYRTKNQYDVIVSEPSNPWVSGVASLFTDEFYQRVNRNLKPDGLFVQWLQLYEINLDLVASVMKSLGENFEDYALYSTDDANMLIVATQKRSLTEWGASIFEGEMGGLMDRINVVSQADIDMRLLGYKRHIAPYFDNYSVPLNSDFFPYLAVNAPKSRFLREAAIEIPGLRGAPLPVLSMLVGADLSDDISLRDGRFLSFLQARQYASDLLDGKSRNGLGDQAKVKALSVSCFSDVNEDEALFAMKTLAISQGPFMPIEASEKFWAEVKAQCQQGERLVAAKWADLFLSIYTHKAKEMD